jgi:hypothetical protein
MRLNPNTSKRKKTPSIGKEFWHSSSVSETFVEKQKKQRIPEGRGN